MSLPLIQNAEGHVYCVACEQYFAQVGQDLAAEREGDSSQPSDLASSVASPEMAASHKERRHTKELPTGFTTAAGEEELTLFRQLRNCQKALQQARRVWECRRTVSEVSHILQRLQTVQLQRRF